MEHRQAEAVLGLVGPVSVEGIGQGVRAGDHNGLTGTEFLDLGDQPFHGLAVHDFARDASAEARQRRERGGEGLGGFGARFRRVGGLGRQFSEGLRDFQHGEVLQKIHQKVPFGVGRDQDHQGRVPSGQQSLDVDAVIGAQGFFCQNDDWITHAPSLAVRHRPCTDIAGDGPGASDPQQLRAAAHAGADDGAALQFSQNGAMASSLRFPSDTLRIPPAQGEGTPERDGTAAIVRGSAKWAAAGAIGGGAAAALLAAGSSALALYFARRVITPASERPQDQEILAVIREGNTQQVILAATPDATLEGVYGLFFDNGRGHARIGRIVSYSPAERTVLREVEAVYSGDLSAARRGSWSGTIHPDPATLGVQAEDVLIEVDGGTAPAWLVRAAPVPGVESDVWAIMVHGRGASRQEGLRVLETAGKLGMSSLLISYRNDGLAPSAADGRYGLGSTEWRDVEAAITYALGQGAREVVLFGWSMGGAICLQTADLSRHRQVIRALVLDAPVISWVNVLAHHAELNRIPTSVGRYGQVMLGHRLGRRLTGLAAPVNFKAMDWISRAVELRTPTLILHSVDDEYVPYGPSANLAEKNPEMVTFEPFDTARHTKEWNVDPERWERLVAAWLRQQLAPRTNPGQSGPGGVPGRPEA